MENDPKSEMNDNHATGPVPALERALDILEYLEACDQGSTLSEIAARLRVPKASAHRLLSTLRARGYIAQSGARGGFTLGVRVLGLAACAQAQLDIVRVARGPMQQLAEATGESCQLSVRSGGQALCIARIASPLHPEMSLLGRVGSAFPLHAVAVGKALLAWAPEAERAAYLERALESFTPRTQTAPPALARELEQIRGSGIAHDDQEYKLGVRAVAVPIFEHDGAVNAALALPLLVGGVKDADDLWQATEALRVTAQTISRALGYNEDNYRDKRENIG